MGVSVMDHNMLGDQLYGGKIVGERCVLFIFPPERHHMQVLRPYVYNFNKALAHAMVGGDPYSFAHNGFVSGITDAVMPSVQGEQLDTYNLDSYYTFILIIDSARSTPNLMNSGAPPQRSVMIGYFLDEPVASMSFYTSNPNINPNACMIFTHVDMVESGVQYLRQGMVPSLNVTNSCDFVHQLMAQNYTPVMALTDYSSIAHAHGYNTYGNAFIRNRNPLSLSELHRGATHIPEELKSPKQHLVGITEAAQRASSLIGNSGGHSPINNELGISDDPFETASSVFIGALQKKGLTHALLSLLDPTTPTQLSKLGEIFGNRLQVKTCGIENKPQQYELSDPRALSAESILSSMVANTVTAYCRTNNISMIQFRYSSYEQGMYGSGKWDVANMALLVMSEDGGSVYLERFKVLMERGLFPLLMAQLGHFNLLVVFNSTSDVMVCLNSYDNSVRHEAFHVQHNRLGGLVNPNIGTYESLQNNQSQLNSLFNTVVSDLTSQHAPADNGFTDYTDVYEDDRLNQQTFN